MAYIRKFYRIKSKDVVEGPTCFSTSQDEVTDRHSNERILSWYLRYFKIDLDNSVPRNTYRFNSCSRQIWRESYRISNTQNTCQS